MAKLSGWYLSIGMRSRWRRDMPSKVSKFSIGATWWPYFYQKTNKSNQISLRMVQLKNSDLAVMMNFKNDGSLILSISKCLCFKSIICKAILQLAVQSIWNENVQLSTIKYLFTLVSHKTSSVSWKYIYCGNYRQNKKCLFLYVIWK